MNKFQLLFFLILIKFFVAKESNLDFLNSKTIDVVRQIYWSAVDLLTDGEIKSKYKNEDIFGMKKGVLINKINKTLELLLNETTYYSEDELFEMIKDNAIFDVKSEDDVDNLIRNEKIPKNFIINFAFNLDKYLRTEKQEINGALDYINYLTRKDLIKYLSTNLKEFPNLKSPENFKKYILNDVNFNFADIDAYIKSKSKNELIQLIYGFEKYCFSYDNNYISNCKIPFQMYNHDTLDFYNIEDLKIYISTYKRKLDINDLDVFINSIENRGFSYINPKKLFANDIKRSLIEYVKAFETYFKKQTNRNESLSKRDEYIESLNSKQLQEILEWGVDLYPELAEKVRFKDITSNQINLQYGQVKDFLKVTERSQLLKYAYNIHTIQNNITSKYENQIIDFIRLNNDRLYDQISIDTNKNINLQEKNKFDYYASLYEHDIKEYLKNLKRNQLKMITKKIINLSQGDNQNGETLSKKKNLFDSIDNMSDEELLKTSLEKAANKYINNIDDIQVLESQIPDEDLSIYYFYFYNIMDFFRSTDINYLRIWLRKYELEIRKIRSERYIAGGLKNNFMNIAEYPKDEILRIFDIYVYEYPELFYPEKFIVITGLDNGITPHKFLVENRDNEELLKKIIFSIIGHMQRKNIQLNFDYLEYLVIVVDIFNKTEDDVNNKYIKNNFLYSIFRLINIFPELNNMVLFDRLCINETTRVLNLFDIEDELIFNTGRDLKQIKKNIDYYYLNTGFVDLGQNMDDSDQSDILEIKNFIFTKPFTPITKLRVIDGDFYPLFYNFSLYLIDESDAVINNIYNGLYTDEYVKVYVKNRTLVINHICEAINKYKELQNITFFDSKYNNINIESEKYEDVEDIYNYLKKLDNRQLFYYCLIANLIKINYEKEISSIKEIPDIYLKIHYMSRNAMIRYILNIAKSNNAIKSELSEENMRRLTKKYMLDLGSANVYDLTMF